MIRTTTQAIMNLSSLPAPFYPGIAQPNGSLIGATNNTTSSASSTNGSGGCKANVVNISHRFHFNNNNNAQTTMTFNPTTTTNNNNHKTNTSNNNHIDCHSNNHHIDMDIESDDDNIITVDDADVGPSKPKRAKIDSDQHIAVATNHNGHHIISRKFPEEISERAEFSRQCLEKSDEDLENNSQNYDDEGDSDDDDGEEEEEDDDNLEGNSDDVYDNDSGSPVVQDSNRNPPVNRNSGTHSTPPPPSLSVSSSPSKLLSSISSPPSSLSPASHVSVLLSQPASSSSTQSSPSLSPQSSKIAVNKQLFIKLEIEEDSNSNPTPNHKNNTNPTLNHPDISSVSSTVASRFITHGIKPSSLESTNPHLPSHSSSSTSHSQREHPSPNSFSINSVETPPQSPQTPPSCISTTSSPHNLNTPSSSSSFHHSPLNLSSSCLELKTSSPKTSQENLLTRAILASSSSPSSIPSSSPEHHQHHLSPTHNKRQITAMYPYCDSNPNPNHHPNSLQRHSTQSPPTTSVPKSTRSSMSPDSHKPTKKTNFSIDAILSSNFGNENKMDDDDIDVTDDGFHGNRNVNNTADNRSSTEYNDNDNNNVDEIITNEHQNTIRPRGLEPPAIKSTHSAFTTVMDLSLKTKIVPHLTPPHAPLQPPAPSSEQSLPQHQIPTIPTVVAPTATPPSPPLSSPSSSSTSSLQRSFCRTPQDDDENTTTSPTSTNNPHHHHNNYENFKLLSPNKSDLLKTFPMYNPLDPSTFNPNTHNLEKQFPFLTQHPQFIYPFTPGSTAISTNQPILKNPSLFIERHFPMFYNTFTQTPGKFPPFYNPHIQNSNFPPELHNTPHNRQPIIKPEYKIPDNLAQNITFNPASFHQPRPNTNQHPKRKPQQNSLPSDLIFQRNTPSHPHTSPILADISSPGSNTDSHQSFYTKYSMDIKEKLNSILENISPPPPHSKRDTSSFHEHKQLPTNPKRESKFPEKSGNTSHKQQPTPGSNCKPETLKNNFRLDGSQNGHVGNVPKRSKSMTRDPSDRDVVRQQNGSKNNKESEKKGENPLLPAWVFCTRYSDRPSSGPRSRKPKRKPDQEEKRPRTAFTNDQLMRLRREFDDCRYLTETRRQSLANELGLSESQIKIWFQNKRAKIKKSVGVKNPLALQLMKQGLYNHATMKSDDDEEEMMAQ